MVRGLSGRQRRLLELIEEGIQTTGAVPPLRTLGERMDGISPSAVHLQLAALARKGYLRWPRGRPQQIEMLRRPPAPETAAGEAPGPWAIPVVGTIAAGHPIDAFEAPDGHVLVDPARVRSGRRAQRDDLFALRVNGDSMVDACIQDGDVVVVRRQETAADGETVVALIRGAQATLKRFYRDASKVRLQPANSYYPALTFDMPGDVAVQGVVVGVVRYC